MISRATLRVALLIIHTRPASLCDEIQRISLFTSGSGIFWSPHFVVDLGQGFVGQ